MRRAAAAAAAWLLAAGAGAQTIPLAAPSPAAPSFTALHLARQLAGETLVMAQTRRVLRTQLPSALRANPDMAAMEKRWPGITREFVAVMEPVILASLSKRLPAYQAQVASVFDRRMTPTELAATDAFYTSPAGQHMLSLIGDGVDFSTLLNQQIGAAGDAKIEANDIRASVVPLCSRRSRK